MYIAYTDASVNKKHGGIGFAIFDGDRLLDRCRKRKPVSNSTNLECEALKELLNHLQELKINNVEIRTDLSSIPYAIRRYSSPNVSSKNRRKVAYIAEIAELVNDSITITWIPRSENKIAHSLSREAASGILPDLSESKIKDLKDKNTYELKRVLRKKRAVLRQCSSCGEHKQLIEFSKRRNRSMCRFCKERINYLRSQ